MMEESKLYKIRKHGRTFFIRELVSGWCKLGELVESTLEWKETLIDKEASLQAIWIKCGSNTHEQYNISELEELK